MSLFAKSSSRYLRLHCPHCNLIWGSNAIGSQSYCQQCQRKLILKNFNPWSNLVESLGTSMAWIILYAVVSAIVSLVLSLFGIIAWQMIIYGFVFPLGALLWGFKKAARGFKQWKQIQELDKKQ